MKFPRKTLLLLCLLLSLALQAQKVEPRWESLNRRGYPQWFSDAKLGIFADGDWQNHVVPMADDEMTVTCNGDTILYFNNVWAENKPGKKVLLKQNEAIELDVWYREKDLDHAWVF